MLRLLGCCAILLCLGGACISVPMREADVLGWRSLEPGLELGIFEASDADGDDARIRVLRIDPGRFSLKLLNASATGGESRTPREWCREHNLLAAINAGMFQEDLLTSVSLMRSRGHVNNPALTRHKAVLAFDALDPEDPQVRIIDLGCESFEDWSPRYGSLVQSIRMISCDGLNVWSQQPMRWSTAAIGTDRAGNVLFVHVRAPFTTHDLIDVLIEKPLDIERLMYAEGGPQAQLYVDAADPGEPDLGSWPIPNVVAVARR